jgi:hypothetical protein
MAPTKLSTAVIVAGLVSIVALATAAVLFTSGDAALERLGILAAIIAPIAIALAAALKADQAARSTDSVSSIAQALNGGFEARVRHANRETAAETGTRADVNRAEADAETSVALSAHPAFPPDPPVRPT